MKKLSAYLFLILFSFQTSSWADDIQDFQIAGISVGDSLLDYFTEEEIKKKKKNIIILTKIIMLQILFLQDLKLMNQFKFTGKPMTKIT